MNEVHGWVGIITLGALFITGVCFYLIMTVTAVLGGTVSERLPWPLRLAGSLAIVVSSGLWSIGSMIDNNSNAAITWGCMALLGLFGTVIIITYRVAQQKR